MVKAKFLVDISEDNKFEEKMKNVLEDSFTILKIMKRGQKTLYYTNVGIVEYVPRLKKIIVRAKNEVDTLITALQEAGFKLKRIVSEHPVKGIKTE
ncbi:MAG: hypothetical protein ACTSYM_06870 [Candidatus Baldrarchaeia archaeon]